MNANRILSKICSCVGLVFLGNGVGNMVIGKDKANDIILIAICFCLFSIYYEFKAKGEDE